MKLRTAFILSLLAVIAVMALPALLGVQHVRQVRSIALDLRERTAEAALAVGRVQTGLERLDRYQRAYVATGDPELAWLATDARTKLEEDLERLRSSGYGQAVDQSGFQLPLLADLWGRTTLHLEEGRPSEATDLLRARMRPLMEEQRRSAEALAGGVDAITAARLGSVDRITSRAVTITTSALIVALLVAAALTVLTARVLTRPLQQLSDSMARVADGALDPPGHLPYERRDEIGQLFRTFRSMALRLADLDRMKAQFVGIASHDLKTPANVISGYASLLSEELGPAVGERHRSIITAMERQSRSLGTRLDQLLEISRIQSVGLRLGLEEINLRHYTSEIARAHSAAGRRHRIEVSPVLDDSAPTFLIADPDCLRTEVFGKILENAVRFSPRDGRVTLRASGAGGMVVFEIVDQGPAIPPDLLPHVFDRYYRGRDATGRVGASLGLPIARGAVEAHGGTIEVEAPPTGGTVFRVTLPIHPTLRIPEDEKERQQA